MLLSTIDLNQSELRGETVGGWACRISGYREPSNGWKLCPSSARESSISKVARTLRSPGEPARIMSDATPANGRKTRLAPPGKALTRVPLLLAGNMSCIPFSAMSRLRPTRPPPVLLTLFCLAVLVPRTRKRKFTVMDTEQPARFAGPSADFFAAAASGGTAAVAEGVWARASASMPPCPFPCPPELTRPFQATHAWRADS